MDELILMAMKFKEAADRGADCSMSRWMGA
jgi:hypothetical protein